MSPRNLAPGHVPEPHVAARQEGPAPMPTTTTDDTTTASEAADWARALVDQLYLDARNQAVCTPTRRLRGQHHRLRTHRRHGRLTVWQTVQLAAAHQILLERGHALAPVDDLSGLYWNQPHA